MHASRDRDRGETVLRAVHLALFSSLLSSLAVQSEATDGRGQGAFRVATRDQFLVLESMSFHSTLPIPAIIHMLTAPQQRIAAAAPYYRLGQELHRLQGIPGPSAARSHLRDPLLRRHQHQHQHQQCRTLFSLPKMPKLPNLPDLLNTSSSRHYKDRTLLKYSQQEFYDVVANVDDYHKFLPWCTYSKMSPPVQEMKTNSTVITTDEKGRSDLQSVSSDMRPTMGGQSKMPSSMQHQPLTTTIRHGELGIGFNSMQERYVSTVTCQEPWMVRAVSYDSNLFKELSTTWKFTPNAPKTTSLEAAMDQEVNEEISLLTRPVQENLPKPQPSPPQLTAAAVFGASALPSLKPLNTQTMPSPSSSSPTYPSSTTSTTTPSSAPFPAPPKSTILRTASPSNLATMRPSDYPSVWVDFEIEFEFSSPVHASMSSLFFDQVSKEMLQAFVKRAEALYGKRC